MVWVSRTILFFVVCHRYRRRRRGCQRLRGPSKLIFVTSNFFGMLTGSNPKIEQSKYRTLSESSFGEYRRMS
jgi:hypothetical protein